MRLRTLRATLRNLTTGLLRVQTAAFDKGKGEDTFGADDADWLLYRKMAPPSQGGDSDEADDDEAELAHLTARLHQVDPAFQPGEGARALWSPRRIGRDYAGIDLAAECVPSSSAGRQGS